MAAITLTGCAGNTTASGDLSTEVSVATKKSEYEGNVSSMTLVFTNNSDNQVCLGNDFTVEVKDGNVWTKLDEKTHFIDDIQISVNAGKEVERGYGVAGTYGTLAQGEYRIGVDVSFD